MTDPRDDAGEHDWIADTDENGWWISASAEVWQHAAALLADPDGSPTCCAFLQVSTLHDDPVSEDQRYPAYVRLMVNPAWLADSGRTLVDVINTEAFPRVARLAEHGTEPDGWQSRSEPGRTDFTTWLFERYL